MNKTKWSLPWVCYHMDLPIKEQPDCITQAAVYSAPDGNETPTTETGGHQRSLNGIKINKTLLNVTSSCCISFTLL